MKGESVLIKHVNSGFIGPNFERDLRIAKITRPIFCGATANHCVETTTRMSGKLGFDGILVSDAIWAYGAIGPDDVQHSASEIHSMSLCNMDGEFASVLSTDVVLELLKA